MKVGVAEVDITPTSPVELTGFAARQQPMTGVLDPLRCKALYLEHDDERLLWVHLDLLALDGGLVETFRDWCTRTLELAADQVLMSATHTHSGPATISLEGCGLTDATYLEHLNAQMRKAAQQATTEPRPCQLVQVKEDLDLAIDRRNQPSRHTDPRVSAIGFKQADGNFAAVVLNYAMHPVALGSGNRQVSADWCAGADETLRALPGQPVVLVTNGAAGNLNPPSQSVPPDTAYGYGRAIAQAVHSKLTSASPATVSLRLRSVQVPLPLEVVPPSEIGALVERHRANPPSDALSRQAWNTALDTWQAAMTQQAARGSEQRIPIELQAVRLGPILVLAVNGEMFSRFTQQVRDATRQDLFVVGYANAAFGYIPTDAAYDEGGYEVDTAHFFYNSFRPRRGGLELLADHAIALVRWLS